MEFSQESFERVVGSYPGEGDIGSGRYSTDTRDMGMEGFFKEVHLFRRGLEVLQHHFGVHG